MAKTRAPRGLTAFVSAEFEALADSDKAGEMQAYMKSTMPFYGVQKPRRVPVFRAMLKGFVPESREAYEAGVRALWKLKHREERYAALAYAAKFKRFIVVDSLPLYEMLIRSGAWWDLVDETVAQCLSPLFLAEREALRPTMDAWIADEDMWIRRAAILSQLKHKASTDPKLLFRYCLKRAHEKEFFIRKAIGWALREYAKTAPEGVRNFAEANRERLSGLSYREATKRL